MHISYGEVCSCAILTIGNLTSELQCLSHTFYAAHIDVCLFFVLTYAVVQNMTPT